jgi:disulfide bond formation protein DsbB
VKREPLYTVLACAVLALTAIPVGGAVFVLGFIRGDSPCVMCWEQRTAMVLIALIGLFVLRYGPRPKYIGLAVLVGAWGLHMGTRHASLHAMRDVGQGFSIEILGAHTYVWAAFIFMVCIVMLGVLLMSLKHVEPSSFPRRLGLLEKLAMWVFLAVVAGNIVQAFASTGPPPYVGQSDPIRFSFNPKHWVWALDEWRSAAVSLRGRWDIEPPDVTKVPADPAAGPLKNLSALTVKQRRQLSLSLRGAITDLAYDGGTDRFLITTEHGVYIVDGALEHVLRSTVVDPGFSVDLGTFAGAAFLDSRTVMALGENKSFVILRESDKADAAKNFRFFLESVDRFDEVTRSRLATMRAKMMYVMSLAFDPGSKSFYTVSVPNQQTRRLVISRFAQQDLTLSEEYSPVLAPDSELGFSGDKRTLGEYFVTGATIAGDRMYVISAAYSTLLCLDPAKHSVVTAHVVPGLEYPTGIASKGDELYIITRSGALIVVDRQ